MAHATAESLLAEVGNLPTMPQALRELMAEFERPEVNVSRVSRLIGADPVLTAKLLRLANSAFYHRAGTVERLQDAVVFVGVHATRNLVMSVGLAGSIQFPARFPALSFWRYSLHAAVASRYLARQVHADSETAFAIGLMRAIGVPLAAGALGPGLSALDPLCPYYDEGRTEAERERLGYSYVDVTAALAARWRFPGLMVSALRESEGAAGSPYNTLGHAVALGAWMAGEHEWRRRFLYQLPPAVESRLQALGLDASVLRQMPPLPELAQGLETLMH